MSKTQRNKDLIKLNELDQKHEGLITPQKESVPINQRERKIDEII